MLALFGEDVVSEHFKATAVTCSSRVGLDSESEGCVEFKIFILARCGTDGICQHQSVELTLPLFLFQGSGRD